MIVGTFENDKLNKRGKIITDKFEYEGEILDNKPHGQGTRIIDGSEYIGKWRNGFEDGKGRLTFKNGDFYEGNFKRGQFFGYGIYTKKNGEKYEGNFNRGKKEGKGIIHFPISKGSDFSSYEGDWEDDVPNGTGTVIYENGSIYVGEVVNGEITGKGRMEIKEMKVEAGVSKVYEGDFVNRLFDGKKFEFFSF